MKAFSSIVSILVADDDDDDRMLIKKAFDEIGFTGNLYFTTNGEETLNFLRRQAAAKAAKSLLPDMLLLDLNMPKKNGFEVMREIKEDPKLAAIPIVILSTTQTQADADRSYQAGAVGFLTKPSYFTDLVEALRLLAQFAWASI